MSARLDKLVMALSYVAVVAIIVLSLVPGSSRLQTGAPGQGEHVIAYFLTAILFGLRSSSISMFIRLGTVFIAGAGILEFARL